MRNKDGSAVVNSATSSWLFIPDAKDVLPNQYEYEVRDDEEVSAYLTAETSGIKWFTFMFNPKSSNTKYYNKGLVPYDYENSTLEGLKEDNSLGCKKDTTKERAYCARVIQLNGWKIPDDYFYKF